MECIHNCSICGKTFSHNNKTIATKIKKHIKEEHNMNFKDYIIHTFHGDSNPLCQCGCGQKVKFTEKDALWSDLHGFTKFVHCSHAGRNRKITGKASNLGIWGNKDWVLNYYKNNFSLDDIQKSALEFIDGNSALELANKYKIDVRTLRKSWVRLKLITEGDLVKISQERKYKSAQKRRKIFLDDDEICSNLILMLMNFPQKFTINSLKKEYNKTHMNSPLEVDNSILYDSLVERYGANNVNELIIFGGHSKEELNFLNVLHYYIGKKIVKCGFKLYYTINGEKKFFIYDFKIGNKLLIEYDGAGYYHSSNIQKEKDSLKEITALNNGYKILRLTDKDVKKPETILKIKELVYE